MLYMSVARIMNAVAEQTSSVSTYTANDCTKPCCAGCCTSAAAAAFGPVPCQAALEYMPLLKHHSTPRTSIATHPEWKQDTLPKNTHNNTALRTRDTTITHT